MAFYAVICGLLGLVVPPSLSGAARFAAGAAVGLAAAAGLPVLRAATGL